MRAQPFVFAVVTLALLVAAAARADTVRVAVVGFDSQEPTAPMRALSAALRDELQQQLEKGTFAVVAREEMSAAYFKRGGPCLATDTRCLLEASAMWNGRLFVRGHTERDANGVLIEATLESVRGVLVAKATARAKDADGLAQHAPLLARNLVDGERAFRTSKKVTEFPVIEAAPTGPHACAARAQQGRNFIEGELTADDKGVAFAPTAKGAKGATWTWANLEEVRAIEYEKAAALQLFSKGKEPFLALFADAAARDACARQVDARRITKK